MIFYLKKNTPERLTFEGRDLSEVRTCLGFETSDDPFTKLMPVPAGPVELILDSESSADTFPWQVEVIVGDLSGVVVRQVDVVQLD